MKYILLFLVASFVGAVGFSQTTIKLEDVSKHVGDSVKVCGKVYGIRQVATVQNEPTFINLGGGFPNQLLTVVIWSDVRKQFEQAPEELFKDKEICVVGRIEVYKERPQIVIRERGQVSVQ